MIIYLLLHASSQTDYNNLAPRVENVLLVLFLFFSSRSYVSHEFPVNTAVNNWVRTI